MRPRELWWCGGGGGRDSRWGGGRSWDIPAREFPEPPCQVPHCTRVGKPRAREWKGLACVTLGAGSSGRPRAQAPLPPLLTSAQRGRLVARTRDTRVGRARQAGPLTEDFCLSRLTPRPSCPIPPAGALEIRQALPIHAGRYTCTAQNAAGAARKHVVLTVQGRVPRAFSSDSRGPGGWGAGAGRARGAWGWGGAGGPRFRVPRPASDLTPPWDSGRKPAPPCVHAEVSGTSCSP